MKLSRKLLLGAGMFLFSFSLLAQASSPENWFHLDPQKDGYYGVSTAKAYELAKGIKGNTVVVAVIDSGIDIEHEDLKDVIWSNPGEIPGNGKDDDGNGYVDDVHGWNFIGGKDGSHVAHDNLEVTRLYRMYMKKFEGKDAEKLSKKEKKEYEHYMEVKEVVETAKQSANDRARSFMDRRKSAVDGLKAFEKVLGDKELTLENVKAVESDDENVKRGQSILTQVLSNPDAGETTVMQAINLVTEQMQPAIDYFQGQANYYYNVDFDPRNIVGDNYTDATESTYGNNDVEGPDAFHGTHVAGIIAATRGNDIGMDGVAQNVRIMSIRTVPDGDERDKDVANAIRYAVDNGATVVNMSFGKGYSWDKKVVDDAVKYAEKHDVLLVHAAGNDGKDNDSTDNFPTDKFEKKGLFQCKKEASNWLEIGALSPDTGDRSAASFSNYGIDQVDLFAPGMEIYSTTPDNNYQRAQGTSMASPVVAGVAAMIRSYYPTLSAKQVKEVIMSSVEARPIKVIKPGTQDEKVDFSSLSVSGGTVNAYKAMKLASGVKGKKKVKKVSKT